MQSMDSTTPDETDTETQTDTQTHAETPSMPDPLREIGTGRPAQDKLHLDQQSALETFVEDGFATRRAYFQWLQDVAWLTFGRLRGRWYARVARDRSVLAVVITAPHERQRLHRDPPPLDEAAQQRRRLATKYLRPAFTRGYREFRGEADEHVDEEDEADPRESTTFAMRPTLDYLKSRQAAALKTWLDGFDDRSHLDRHLHRLDDLTLGEFERVTSDFDWRVELDPVVQECLLGDRAEHRFQREQLAARYLLPSFAPTPQVLLSKTQEVPDDGPRQTRDPPGWEP